LFVFLFYACELSPVVVLYAKSRAIATEQRKAQRIRRSPSDEFIGIAPIPMKAGITGVTVLITTLQLGASGCWTRVSSNSITTTGRPGCPRSAAVAGERVAQAGAFSDLLKDAE
jgi:hypothetical protein